MSSGTPGSCELSALAKRRAAGAGWVLAALLLLGCSEPPEAGVRDAVLATLPAERGGQDLLGLPMPALGFDRWVRGSAPAAGRVTLYRWWTDTCPFCSASLPAVEALRRRYEAEGLAVVAVYHPKPPRAVSDADTIAAASQFGYEGSLALDADWSVLRDFYLSTGRRAATSASFLVDAQGVVRFVHPGPEFFPSDDPDEARQDADHRLLEAAIVTLLSEAGATAGG